MKNCVGFGTQNIILELDGGNNLWKKGINHILYERDLCICCYRYYRFWTVTLLQGFPEFYTMTFKRAHIISAKVIP